MVPTLRSLVLIGTLALAAAVQVRAAASFVPFSLDSVGGIVVAVRINGRGPYKMLVDTGSSRAALSRQAAVQVGAAVVAKTSVVSIGQEATRLVVRLDQVEAGSAVRPNLLASVIPDAELKAVAAGVDGILGQDFLAAFDYTIDYRKRTLAWETDVASIPAADARFSLRPEEGRFLVEIPRDDGQRSLRLVPDSGASVLVLYARDGRPPVSVGPTRRPLDIAGLSGARRASLSSVTLRIGPVLLRDAPVVVLSACDDVPGADGLLPLSLFGRASFLASKGLVVFQKN